MTVQLSIANVPVVGQLQRELAVVAVEKRGARHERGYRDGQRERIYTAVFFPTILVTHGTRSSDEPEREANHLFRPDTVERIVLVEQRREQHRESRLVELNSVPEGRAAEPLVLIPVTVRVLRRYQVAQHVTRLVPAADAEQRTRALDEIARPHEVITAALVARIAPRHAQARHHGAGIHFVLMTSQHHARGLELRGQHIGQAARPGAGVAAAVPLRPQLRVRAPDLREGLLQRRRRKRGRRNFAGAEAERERTATP